MTERDKERADEVRVTDDLDRAIDALSETLLGEGEERAGEAAGAVALGEGQGAGDGAAEVGEVAARGWGGLSRRSKVKRVVVAGLVVLVGMTVLMGLVGVALMQEQPSWWRRVDATHPETIETARVVENGAQSVLTVRREIDGETGMSEAWAVSLRATDANAWLNVRLRKWLANQEREVLWPEEIREVQVEFDDDRIYVGARVEEEGGGSRVVSATVVPTFDESGSLWMPATTLRWGRLGVPAGWVLTDGVIEEAGEERVGGGIVELPQTREVLAAFAGKNPVLVDPTIRLGDGRRVRVLGMRSRDGKLEITCVTVR